MIASLLLAAVALSDRWELAFGPVSQVVVAGAAAPAEPPSQAPTLTAHYYMAVFSHTDPRPWAAQRSHTFASFFRVLRDEHGKVVEAERHHISWIPYDGWINILRKPAPGIVNRLETDLKSARCHHQTVSLWGPVKVKPEFYALAIRQHDRLQAGGLNWVGLDKRTRVHGSFNCIHAIADIDTTRPMLITKGTHGVKATRLVVGHFVPWMIEPARVHDDVRQLLPLAGTCIRQERIPTACGSSVASH